MTSIVRVDQLTNVAGSGNIQLLTNNKIVGADVASIYAPGMVIQNVYSSRVAGAINVTSTSWVELSTSLRTSITIKQATSILDFTCPLYTEVDGPTGHGIAALYYSTNGGSSFTSYGTYNITAAVDNGIGYGFADYWDHSFSVGDTVMFTVYYRLTGAGQNAIADTGPGENPRTYLKIQEIAG